MHLLRVRGIAVGTIVAILIMVAITAYAVYKIYQATTVAYRALTEYATAAQKPVFAISTVDADDNNVNITVVNTGPTAAVVKKVMLYKYVASNVPSDIYIPRSPVNQYLAVGDSFTISIPKSLIYEFMAYNLPLRMLIVTDRGLSLIGMKPPVSELVVNVYIPAWIEVGDLRLQGSCIERPIPLSGGVAQSSDGRWSYEIVKSQNVINFIYRAKVFGIGECKVEVYGTPKYVVIGNQNILEEKTNPPPQSKPLYYIWSSINTNLIYRASVLLRPGAVSTVDIKLSDVLVKNVQPPPDGEEHSYTQIIDFSWYYQWIGIVTSEPKAVREDTSGNDPVSVTKAIINSGIIVPLSPGGCSIYPVDNLPSDVKNAIYQWMWSGQGGTYIRHTGVPIAVINPETCSRNGQEALRIVVPIYLSEGKYLIVPIFTYDDKDTRFDFSINPPRLIACNEYKAQIIVGVEGTTASAIVDENEDPKCNIWTGDYGAPRQAAVPLTVSVGSPGTYNLYIAVRPKVIPPGHADYAAVVLSKIVIMRAGNYTSMCTFVAGSLPTFPFAIVDLQTGQVTRTSRLVYNAIHYEPDSQKAYANIPSLMIYSDAYSISGRYIEASAYGITIKDKNGNPVFYVNSGNARRNYFWGMYSVTIKTEKINTGVSVNSMQLQGYAPEICYVYYGIDDYCYFFVSVGTRVNAPAVNYPSGARTDVEIKFGDTGVHYVLVSFIYLAPASNYTQPPSISYSIVSGSMRVEEEDQRLKYPWPTTPALWGAEYVLRVNVYSSGSILRISTNSGVSSTTSSVYWIGHVIVVKKPTDPDLQNPATPLPTGTVFDDTLLKEVGIYVRNVKPIISTGYVVFTLMRADSGETIATWLVPVDQILQRGGAVLLRVSNIFSRDYSIVYSQRNLVENYPYMLIVQNAQCPVK